MRMQCIPGRLSPRNAAWNRGWWHLSCLCVSCMYIWGAVCVKNTMCKNCMFSVHENPVSVSRFSNRPHTLLNQEAMSLRCVLLQLYLLFALKRHKRCPTNAITKFSKSRDRYSSVYFHVSTMHALRTQRCGAVLSGDGELWYQWVQHSPQVVSLVYLINIQQFVCHCFCPVESDSV